MVKKLLTLFLGLALAFNASAQLVTIDPSDVQFWTGSGSNSTVVAIGWDDDMASYTPTVVIWGVRWEGSIYLINALDTIAAYDTRFSYTMGSSGFLQTLTYNDPDNGIVLTPSMEYNCNSYGGAYGSTTLNSTHLRISESTCSNYTFTGVSNIIYASDPNVVFSCAKPQAVTVTDLTSTTATVNITDTTFVNDYTVKLYENDSLIDSVVIYTQTISYTTLTDNTGYTVKVFSNCSDGTQTSARSISFRTPCIEVAHTNLPWTEDFQSGTGTTYASASSFFSNYVFCWNLLNPYSTSDPYINNSSSVNVSGGQCLYVTSRPSSPTVLVLPPFEDTPDQLQLSFDVLSSYGHGFEAGVISDPTDYTTFTPIASCLPAGSGWNHFEVTFAGFTSGRIALRSNDNGPAYLDNVVVEELPSCVKPSQVIVSNITASSADLTITDPNNTGHYMVYATEEDSVEIYSDNYTLTNLLPNTRYVVRVKTVCTDHNTDATSAAFRTGCGAMDIPFHEDFSQFVDVANGYSTAVTDSTIPCWGYLPSRNLDYLALFTPSQSSSYGYGNGGYTLRIYSNYSNSYDIVVLPEMSQDISTLEMSFMTRPSETGSMGGILEVGYMTDATDDSSFVAIVQYPASQFASGYDLRVVNFANAPADARIALRTVPTGGSAKSWFVDDIDVHDMPACARALGISVDEIGTDGFTLHVDDPTLVNHYRYYVTAESFIDSLDFYDTVVTIAGLSASTDYQIQVVSICDDGTLTLPITMAVSTLCGPVTTLPFVENFDTWTATQAQGMNRCWNRLYSNSSNNLVTNNYPYCASGSSYAYTGFKSLKFFSKGTSSGIKEYSVAYLPEFSSNINNLKINFFYKVNNSSNQSKVRIVVGISETVADTSTFTRLATFTPTNSSWNEYEVDFSGYTGTGNRITIMQTSTSTTGFTSYLDSLVVDTVSSCNRPATFVASNVTANTADLTWTDPSTADSYIINWSDGTTTDSVTVSNVTTYTLTGLTPSTTYTVDIRSICWGAPTNARSLSFTTSCAPMPLPWSMNFDNITNLNQLSSCWNRYSGLYNDSTHTATLTTTSSGWARSTTAFDGSSHVKVNIYGTSCKYWLVTPEINLTENAELTFDYMLTEYNTADVPETGAGLEDDRFIVLATTDNGTSWTPVAQWGNDTVNRDDYYLPSVTNTPSPATVSLSNFTGQVVRLAFYAESTVGGTDNDFRIDNIVVSAATDTTITPPEPPTPEDASIAASEILYWVGEGSNEVVLAINWADTALAWGYRFSTDTATAQQMMDAIAAADPRFSYSGTGFITDINYIDTAAGMTTPLGVTPGNWWWSLQNHVAGMGLGDVLHNGDFYKWGDLSVAVVTDSTDMGSYMDYTYVWPYTIYPVTVPDTVSPIDTTVTAVDATISQDDILFWVGDGLNKAIIAVNWADPDTCLAWGVMWNGMATVKDLMDTIMAHDSRFIYTENGGMLNDIVYTVDGLTLQLTEESSSPWGNYWMYNVNGTAAQNMFNAQEVHNDDFIKWGDPNSGTSIGTDEWGNDILVWTTVVTPVSSTVGIPDVQMIIESIWPNPTSSIVNVSLNRNAKATLYDLSGRCVSHYDLSEGRNILDLSAYPAGVYMLRVGDSARKIVRK